MAQFTTTTVTYSLVKYSRSYPSTQNPATDSEWQHFIHPVIHLYLDAKKSSTGNLVSVRLRIVWNFDSSTNSTDVDQREITLEDLDLLSFSSISNSRTDSGQLDHGLPLKAVYRDAVVGIRYLHPRTADSTCQPVYRRFQITFTTATSAAQFIDAIRPSTTGPPDDISRRGTILPAVSQPQPSNGQELLSDQRRLYFSQTIHHPNPTLPAFASSTPVSTFVTPPETPRITIPKSSQCQAPSSSINSTKGSLPDSSQPSSSIRSSSNAMPPPPLPSSVTRSLQSESRPVEGHDSTRAQLVASLHDSPALHKLSHAELESIVAQVIREEGFAQLLASLDTMWRVKGFLGQ
ncbi:hypothetical protein EDD22DRAFT_1004582 [Suillus occidentalis]|nr:hypothetical protein EDD22DRAFT_1004582 [Suillus occidentalis]